MKQRQWAALNGRVRDYTGAHKWMTTKKQTIPAKSDLCSVATIPTRMPFSVCWRASERNDEIEIVSPVTCTHTPTDTHTHIDRYGDQSWAWQPNGRPGLFPVANRPRSSWGRVCFALGSSAPVQGTTTPSPCLTRHDEAGTMLAKLSALPRQSDPQTKGVTVHRDESARPHRWRCEFPAVTDRFLEVRIHHGREENEKTRKANLVSFLPCVRKLAGSCSSYLLVCCQAAVRSVSFVQPAISH